MKYLDLSLPTPAGNLACEEALLDSCNEGGEEALRVWESPQPFVVLGYANRAALEVNMPACRKRGVPILRRCSGGGTVVQGPGCLSYALVMKLGGEKVFESISETNCFIMKKHAEVLGTLLKRQVAIEGFTDLAINGLKCSGNSQRRKRAALLFHGTFLLDFDLDLVEELLSFPSRQPDYREGRPHMQFLTRLPIKAAALKAALRKVWVAEEPMAETPHSRIEQLVAEKYSRDEWNLKW